MVIVHLFIVGCKWSIRQLRRHLSSSGCSDWLLWQKVNALVSLTILAQLTRLQAESNSIPLGPENCFELYGFDILVRMQSTTILTHHIFCSGYSCSLCE